MPIRRRGGSGGTALSENIVDALEGAASPAAGNPFATVEDIPADLSSDIKAALTGAASPGAENPFATVAEAGGEDDKTVKASSSDTTPGFLDAKVDGASIEVSGDKLRVNPTFLATISAAGLVELATDAETQAGTDTTRSICPASLKSAVPFKTTAAMNLYVNSGAAYGSWGAGSDSNAGTQAAPLATIAAAIAKIPQVLAHAVTINLAGKPNYYEWKPDGTNGIRFTTGDSGVTVAVVSGSTLSVAISGSAVTVTLATGGSTIAQIIAAINASATVGPIIYLIAVGTTSTNITATLSTQALTGGNVRTYAESVSFSGYFGLITLTGGSGCTAGVIIAPATANTAGIMTSNAHSMVAKLTVYTASASTNRAVSAQYLADVSATDVWVIGPWKHGLYASNSTSFHSYCGIYGATTAVLSENGANTTVYSLYGAGNTTGLMASVGLIIKYNSSALGASTAEVSVPSGLILG